MCDPVTIAMGAQAAGQVVQGIGAKNTADQQGKFAMQSANYDSGIIRERGLQQVGNAQVARGKSGVALEGSPLDSLAQAAINVEMDAQARLWSGKVAQQMYKSKGNAALMGGLFGAGKTLAGADLFGGGGGGVTGPNAAPGGGAPTSGV